MPEYPYRERGQRLKAARKFAGIKSQQKLSDLVKIPQVSIARMELGMYDIEADLIAFLEENFNINGRYIVTGEGSIEREKVSNEKNLKQRVTELESRVFILEEKLKELFPKAKP